MSLICLSGLWGIGAHAVRTMGKEINLLEHVHNLELERHSSR